MAPSLTIQSGGVVRAKVRQIQNGGPPECRFENKMLAYICMGYPLLVNIALLYMEIERVTDIHTDRQTDRQTD